MMSRMESSEPEEVIEAEEVEIVSVNEVRAIEPARALPSTQAAVVAATGFAVGAATAAVIVSRGARKPRHGRRRRSRKRDSVLDIASTRSFLVDVHLLKGN